MKTKSTYDKIEDVLRKAGKPIAAHEFENVSMAPVAVPSYLDHYSNGRMHIGQSEATIARRLREMAASGRVIATTRAGKSFREYALPVKAGTTVMATITG